MKRVPVGLRLPVAVARRLRRLSSRTRSQADVFSDALDAFIAQRAWFLDAAAHLQRRRTVRS